MTASAIGIVLLVHLAGLISPGPDVVLIMRTASRSRGLALLSVLGIVSGLVVWVTLSFSGIALIMQSRPLLLAIVQLLGCVWLLYLCYCLARSAIANWGHRGTPLPEVSDSAIGTSSPWGAYRAGLLTNLSNPKATLFFTAIFSQFVPAHATTVDAVVLGGLVLLQSLLVFSLIAVLVSTPRLQRRFLSEGALIDAIAALCFGLIAVPLLIDAVSTALPLLLGR